MNRYVLLGGEFAGRIVQANGTDSIRLKKRAKYNPHPVSGSNVVLYIADGEDPAAVLTAVGHHYRARLIEEGILGD